MELSRKDSEIKRLESEVEKLYASESKMKEESKRLRAEKHHLTLAIHERMLAGRDPLEMNLSLKNQEIWDLNHRILKLQNLVGYFQDVPKQGNALPASVIDDAIDEIVSELDSIPYGHSFENGLLTPEVSSDTDLGALIRSTLGPEGATKEEKMLKDCVAAFDFDPEIVIRTFTIAALRDWVFETDYPSLTPDRPALLDAYRTIALRFGE